MRKYWTLAALGTPACFIATVLMATGVAEAAGALYSDRLLLNRDGPGAIKMVQYSDAMLDCASRLASRRTTACIFVPGRIELRLSFLIWRGESGATINRTRRGEYRLRPPGCLSGFCTSLNCVIPGFPDMVCDDGITRNWSAPDRLHFELDGLVFERIRQE